MIPLPRGLRPGTVKTSMASIPTRLRAGAGPPDCRDAGQRQIWSWISFDVANQSFTLIINTLLFSIFFSEVVVRDPAIDDRLWALTYGSSMLLCALLSPVAGAMADERAWKRRRCWAPDSAAVC